MTGIIVSDEEMFARVGVPADIMRAFLAAVEADPECGFPPKVELFGFGHWPMPQISDYYRQLHGMPPEHSKPWPCRWPKGWQPDTTPKKIVLPPRPYVDLPPVKDIIYFIGAGGHIKIGITSGSIDGRLKTLSTGHYEELTVLAQIDDAPPGLEQELHERFAAHRVRGEWFKAAPELLAYIETIKGQK